jgi:hypothetical protein
MVVVVVWVKSQVEVVADEEGGRRVLLLKCVVY